MDLRVVRSPLLKIRWTKDWSYMKCDSLLLCSWVGLISAFLSRSIAACVRCVAEFKCCFKFLSCTVLLQVGHVWWTIGGIALSWLSVKSFRPFLWLLVGRLTCLSEYWISSSSAGFLSGTVPSQSPSLSVVLIVLQVLVSLEELLELALWSTLSGKAELSGWCLALEGCASLVLLVVSCLGSAVPLLEENLNWSWGDNRKV